MIEVKKSQEKSDVALRHNCVKVATVQSRESAQEPHEALANARQTNVTDRPIDENTATLDLSMLALAPIVAHVRCHATNHAKCDASRALLHVGACIPMCFCVVICT